jgi:hypothetical protein
MANTSNPTKASPTVLVLPSPHRISGDVDAMLESTVAERFKTIILVKNGEKDTGKGQLVLSHTPDSKDPNVQVSTWNAGLGHLLRFVQAGVNAWTSGVGLSGDGSAMYVANTADTVFKTVPQLKGYDIVLVPNGRAGTAKYRIPVPELVSQILNRAKVISTCVEAFGIAQGKERTKKATDAPQITAIL